MPSPPTLSDYICAECDRPITDGEPHTRDDGEDVHAGCCTRCREGSACT